jgi:dethiobiotin synthetase
MTGFFITGTDTDVGKTYITARLAREYLAQGKRVAVRKPVASGCGDQLDACADARILAEVSGEDEWLVCPHRFAPAVSPARAMQEAQQRVLVLDDLVLACRQETQEKITLVEGAGGWLSPLTPSAYNADLASALGLPVILVVANRLGCINHALLTLQAIQQSGLACPQVILNHSTPSQDYSAYSELLFHVSRLAPKTTVIRVDFE